MIRTGDGSNWNKKKKNSLKIIEKNILIVHSFNEQLVSCDLNSTCDSIRSPFLVENRRVVKRPTFRGQ